MSSHGNDHGHSSSHGARTLKAPLTPRTIGKQTFLEKLYLPKSQGLAKHSNISSKELHG